MDAIAHQHSSSRVHTFIALTALAFLSLVVILSTSGSQSIVRHARRSIELSPRQATSTTSSDTSTNFIGETAVPTGTPVSSVSPTASLNSSSSVSSSTEIPSSSAEVSSSSSALPKSSDTPTSSSSRSTMVPSSSSSLISSSSISSTHSTSSTTRTATLRTATPAPTVAETTLALTVPPLTKVVVTPSIQLSSSSSSSVSPESMTRAASSSAFWSNKAAVTATFVIVALAITAIIMMIVVFLLKRRNARKHIRLLDERPESFTSGGMHSEMSHGPSIIGAPMEAFARKEEVYDNVPITARTPHAFIPFSPVQHPDYYNPPPTHYTPHSQLQAPSNGAAPPSAFRNLQARDSTGYQPSFDSFYGAGQPSGYAS